MFISKRFLGSLFSVLVLFSQVCAQGEKPAISNRASATVVAAATNDRLRLAAPSNTVALRLEIYAGDSQRFFDSGFRPGSLLDWTMQDEQGRRYGPGSYLCVVTVKSLSGALSQRLGRLNLGEKDANVQPVEIDQLSASQAQALGDIEHSSSLVIVATGETEAMTVIANDGRDGEIVRGRGAFSFRLGDFFSGTDKEQMRLTEDGSLGIGTENPQARLDVAGTIRASKGIEFADGSVQTTGLSGRKDKDGNIVPAAAGSGTQARLAKWTDNSGTLGDSIALDSGVGLQLTVPPSSSVDTNVLYTNANDRTMGVIASSAPAFTASNGPFFALRGNSYTAIGSGSQRGLFAIAAGDITGATGRQGSIVFNTGSDQVRMTVKPSGNVGIGTETPVAKLDVVGNINTSTQYNIGGMRMLSILGANNLFAGEGAGNPNTSGESNAAFGYHAGQGNIAGSFNSFFGSNAGPVSTAGFNSFFGADAGRNNATGDNNSFFGKGAGFENSTGYDNSFFGKGAGSGNSTGIDNSFFGVNAGNHNTGNNNSFFGMVSGFNNSTGLGNSFFGDHAGEANTTGDHNTVIGHLANVASGDLTYATAIGAGALVSNSNSVVLGRPDGSDVVRIPGAVLIDGTLVVGALGSAGATPLCLNGVNRIAGCSSSLRYKTSVQAFSGGLDIVRLLRPITFDWKDGGRHDIGFGAEEVEKVEPLLTTRNAKGEIEGVKYAQITTVLVNAVNEQQQQIAEQQRIIEAQQQQLKKQRDMLQALKRTVCRRNGKAAVCK